MPSSTLLTVIIVVASLYFARTVLIPFALAVLLAFLLAPLVTRLRHWGLGPAPASFIVVLFSLLVVTVFSSVMVSQMTDLARKVPGYQQNVREKLRSIRTSGGGLMNRVSRFVHNVSEEMLPAPAPSQPNTQPGQERPVPVEIRKAPFAPLEFAQRVLGSLLSVVLSALVVVVFVIFMLIQREDLRDRLLRLLGAGRIHITTQALDDAAGRLARYLLAQLVINFGFGALAGVALYCIGVPDPLLWGIMAALLRYIPYLGIWIAAALPALMVFAVDPGWVKVPLIFGLYLTIDLVMYNFAEPVLYGSSTGISPVAILVSAVFWTWLWGPVGLLLSTPLTVCLVVIGRYVPSLEFLDILLSDRQVLRPETRFYQRLLALDLDEAMEVAAEFLKGKSLEELEDGVIIPALILAEEDRHRGRLDEEQEHFIFQNTRLLLEELVEHAAGPVPEPGDRAESAPRVEPNGAGVEEVEVVCIPARDEADEIAAFMVAQSLNKRGTPAKALSSAALAGECLEQIQKTKARVACVTAVPPHGYMHARYLCRRLRAQFPELRIVGAILTERDVRELKQRQPALPADELGSSIKQALTAVLSLVGTKESAVSRTEPTAVSA